MKKKRKRKRKRKKQKQKQKKKKKKKRALVSEQKRETMVFLRVRNVLVAFDNKHKLCGPFCLCLFIFFGELERRKENKESK